LVLGAFIFGLIEKPREEALRVHIRTLREEFLEDNSCVTDEELENFIVEIIAANDRGVSAVGNVSSEPNWSFGQSIFFAGTVLTTIGYGHVTPLSEGGKIFCIVYALLGIPLTLIMFTAVVERVMILTSKLLKFLSDQLGHTYNAFNIRIIHLTILLSGLLVFIFLIPAAIFTALEHDWNYLDAFYYCFISMTTIGLGDYIPGDKPSQPQRALYKICTTCYLFIGLIMMMLILANIYEVPEFNIGYHFYLKSDEDDAERMRLRPSSEDAGPKYTKQVDEQSAVSAAPHSGQDQERQALSAEQGE